MADERDESRDRDPWSWRVRRWAAPVALAVSVAASIGAAQVLADDPGSSGPGPWKWQDPRFLVTAGRLDRPPEGGGPAPWLQVTTAGPGQPQAVASAPPPSASAGEARQIIPGPDGTFLAASSRDDPCESRLYRFRVADDGRVHRLEELGEDAVPARVAGLAVTRDGGRVAYATAPCGEDAPPGANLTVLDVGSGRRTTWSTPGRTLIGAIAWADDGRTLGYALSDVSPTASPDMDFDPGTGAPSGGDIADVTVHALDTGERGADLRSASVLFRRPDGPGTVIWVRMKPDGRSGYGTMQKGRPPSTIMFEFAEGEPMHVTHTSTPEPNRASVFVLDRVVGDSGYACAAGLDAFGRVTGGDLMLRGPDHVPCESAFVY